MPAPGAVETRPHGAPPDDDPAPLLRALAHGDFVRARAVADRLADPLLLDHVRRTWALARPRTVPLTEVTALLARRPHWPGAATLRRIVERRLDELPPAARDAFLARFPPLTGRGRLALAERLAARGETARARALVRAAWPEAELGAAEERDWRRRFGAWIDPALDAARADRLLWRGRWREARRLRPHLEPDMRRLVEARIRLQRRLPGVDAAIRAVPVRLRDDPGLRFDRIRFRLARGRVAAAAELLRGAPADPSHALAWWRLRRRLVWALLERGSLREAWGLLRRHEAPTPAARAEAGWRAGWLALALGRPGEAYERFRHLHEAVRSPVSRARMAYWAGRAAERLGRAEVARRWYRRAARHPTAFYGQMALAALGRPMEEAIAEVLDGRDRPRLLPVALRRDDRLRLARRLAAAGAAGQAVPYLRAVLREVSDPAEARARLAAVAGWGDARLYVTAAKELARRGLVPRLLAYPHLAGDAVPAAARTAAIDPALLLALARQESHFAVDARSPAGAVGLTQLLPATARAVARRHGLPFGWLRLTRDPRYQLDLAARYLRALLDRFGGDPLLALAAYNAGPARVARWIARFGDPRRMDAAGRLDWLERIPYAETRNYVQRVLEGRAVYRALAGREAELPAFRPGGVRVSRPRPHPRP